MTPTPEAARSTGFREALLDAAALVFPVCCAGCGRDGRTLCVGCRMRLAPAVTSRVLADGLAVHAGLSYDGIARLAILALKECGSTGIARALAPALVAAVAAADAAGDARSAAVVPDAQRPALLCPIPSSRAAARRRGYDPVALVLRRARLEAVPVFRPAARRPTQKALDRGDRTRNRVGAFRVATRVAGARVLLVDDVVTTGATLVEAAHTLREAGAHVVGAVAIASTPLRSLGSAALSENRPRVGDTTDPRRVQ